MSQENKMPYEKVMPMAERLVTGLSSFCERIEIAGSLRRRRPMIGDIEVVALPKWDKVVISRDLFGNEVTEMVNTMHRFISEKVQIIKGVKQTANYISFMYGSYKVDLFVPLSPAHWGSIFTIRTGSHDFNMWVMNERCKEVGIKFMAGRLWRDGMILETPEEGDVFNELQINYVPPNKRDSRQWVGYCQ